MKAVCFTGHRPTKFGGYDENTPTIRHVKRRLRDAVAWVMENEPNCIFICGGALGVDTWAAEAVIAAGGRLHQYLPFWGFDGRWPAASKQRLAAINKQAEEVHVCLSITPTDYKRVCVALQHRNEAMVDASDAVISVCWDNSGGTANCVRYAQAKGKKVYNIARPKEVEV